MDPRHGGMAKEIRATLSKVFKKSQGYQLRAESAWQSFSRQDSLKRRAETSSTSATRIINFHSSFSHKNIAGKCRSFMKIVVDLTKQNIYNFTWVQYYLLVKSRNLLVATCPSLTNYIKSEGGKSRHRKISFTKWSERERKTRTMKMNHQKL